MVFCGSIQSDGAAGDCPDGATGMEKVHNRVHIFARCDGIAE